MADGNKTKRTEGRDEPWNPWKDERNAAFDHRSSMQGARDAAKLRRETRDARVRPDVPFISKTIALHCPAIVDKFVANFVPVCDNVLYIDHVARSVIKNRKQFNRYLQQFDEYLAEIVSETTKLLGEAEALAEGNMTSNSNPWSRDAELRGPRDRQLLDVFLQADQFLRHYQFLSIMGDVSSEDLLSAEAKMKKSLDKFYSRVRRLTIRVKKDVQKARSAENESRRASPKRTRQRSKVVNVRDLPAEPALEVVADAEEMEVIPTPDQSPEPDPETKDIAAE